MFVDTLCTCTLTHTSFSKKEKVDHIFNKYWSLYCTALSDSLINELQNFTICSRPLATKMGGCSLGVGL